MSDRRRGSREAGFTLLEIVVALVVLGILLATLTRGVEFGLAAFDRQDRMITVGGRLQAVDSLLRRLIEQLDPGTSTDGNSVVGARHAIGFRAPLPIRSPEAARDGLGGALADGLADLRLSVNGKHQLILAWLPHRHVTRAGPVPTPHEEMLLDGIDRIDCDYWSDGAWRGQWRQSRPPELIRIRLVFTEGSALRWPDLVVAPVRDQPNG